MNCTQEKKSSYNIPTYIVIYILSKMTMGWFVRKWYRENIENSNRPKNPTTLYEWKKNVKMIKMNRYFFEHTRAPTLIYIHPYTSTLFVLTKPSSKIQHNVSFIHMWHLCMYYVHIYIQIYMYVMCIHGLFIQKPLYCLLHIYVTRILLIKPFLKFLKNARSHIVCT